MFTVSIETTNGFLLVIYTNASVFRTDADESRRADSSVWHSGRLAFFPWVFDLWKVASRKEPGFCLSAMCAMSAKCGSLVLLAVSMNASVF